MDAKRYNFGEISARELLRDDILLMVDTFEDRYVELILDNPDEIKSPIFRKRLSHLESLKMEDNEFIRILYKIITKD